MCLKETNVNCMSKINIPICLSLILLMFILFSGFAFSQEENKKMKAPEQKSKPQNENKKNKEDQNSKSQKDQPKENNSEQNNMDESEQKKGNHTDKSINPITDQDASYTTSSYKRKPIFSPGGKYKVNYDDDRLTIKDANEKILVEKKFPFKIVHVTIDEKTGDRVYLTGKDGYIYCSDITKDDYTKLWKISDKPKGPIIAGPGNDIVIPIKDSLIIRDKRTGTLSNRINNPHKKGIIFMDFLSEHRIITVGKDNIIKIWNKDTGKEIMNRQIQPSQIQAATLSLDKRYLVIGTYDFKIDISAFKSQARPTDLKERFKLKIIDTGNLSIIKEIDGTTAQIREISLSADSKFASVLKDDNTIDVWDLENAYIVQSFTGDSYKDAEFTDDGRYFYLMTSSGQIQRWITQGIVVESSGPQYVGEKYKINTSKNPIITKSKSGITLAILDFSGLLIDSQVAEAISYSFRNKISNYSYINVVERDEMDKILKEQGLQNSGVTSAEAAAEIGRVLNADKLIMGKLSRLGSTLISTIKVVDVESARIEGGREVECQNYALENIPEIIDILLNILIEK